MGSKCNASTTNGVNSRTSQMQNTINEIAVISQKQQEKNALLKPDANARTDSRTLPIGYLSGGNQNVKTQAEVMRLSATIDVLNSKISSQNERLQRTEASLVRANRSMSSERATSNARLLNMQNELKVIRAREETIREQAIAQTLRETKKTSISFDKSVQLAEEREKTLNELSCRVKELTNERNSLTDAAAQSAKEWETRKLDMSRVDVENSKLVEKLSTIEAQYEATKSQLDELLLSDKQTESPVETDSGVDLETKWLNEVNVLKEQNDQLQIKIDELAIAAAAAAAAAEAATVAEAAAAATAAEAVAAPTMPMIFYDHGNTTEPETTLYCHEYAHDDDEYEVEIDEEKPKVQHVLFDTQPQTLRSRCSTKTSCHPVSMRISSLMQREGHGKRLGVATIHPMASYRITRATFNATSESSHNTMTAEGSAPAMPEHVRALVEAVSKDISSACIRKRRAYLTATGMEKEEIDSEIQTYT